MSQATATYVRDGTKYTASNHRARYSPELHDRHGALFTVQELIFMCSSWDGMRKADIAAALGRTHGTVLSKAARLRKQGTFDHFKELGRE